ncbi:hypothetical protein [Aureimonas sp. AU12]|uniref:hypothetical protein n=1 Tax=Aureimonas sp. AU12 TaxID=1638161 RepID=UPI000784CEB5|nr:hypothetical protein [Aureimonas sp. AU12]
MKRIAGLAALALILAAGVAHAEEAASAGGHGAPAAEAPAEAGAAALPAAPLDPKWTRTRTPMPFDVMRSVQFLQDQVARGNDRAIRVQALLLRRFGRTFIEADPAVWQDPRNFRAAILFTLSGGSPEVLDRLSREKLFDEAQTPLVDAARAYARNDLAVASKGLNALDLDGLEPVLAAQISLVMGQIAQVDHPADAVPHLDRARLLAPGTLIEEAALRLEAMLVDGLGQHEIADRLARQYFDRYAASSYAANFEARFGAIFAARADADPAKALASMADVIAGLPDPRQARLFLAVGRRSLVQGNLVFANQASARALALSGLPDADRARGGLYEIASRLGTSDPQAARAGLDGLDRSLLHPEDAKLLDAAYSVLGSIDAPVETASVEVAPTAVPSAPSVLARAEQAIAGASQDLKQSQP